MKKLFFVNLLILLTIQFGFSQSSLQTKSIKNNEPRLESITFMYLELPKCTSTDNLEFPDSLMTIQKTEYFDEKNRKVKSVKNNITKRFYYLNDKLFKEERFSKNGCFERIIYTYKEIDERTTESTELYLETKKNSLFPKKIRKYLQRKNSNDDVLDIYFIGPNGDTTNQRSFTYDKNFNCNSYTSYIYGKVFCHSLIELDDKGEITKVDRLYGEDQDFRKETVYYNQISANEKYIKEVNSDGEISNTIKIRYFDEYGNTNKMVVQKEDYCYVQLYKIKYRN